MARNAIEREFHTSKVGAGGHFIKKIKKNQKFCIDLKWPEMRSKMNFGHPKWPMAAILQKFPKQNKVAYLSERPEMRSKVNFGHRKWPTTAIIIESEFRKKSLKSFVLI